jgi:hypothetical protein
LRIQVDELGFLLFIRIVFGVLVGLLGVTLFFVGVVYKRDVVSEA